MDRTRRHRRLVVVGLTAAVFASFAAPAHAADDTQTVDATLAETLTFTIDSPAISGWALNASGPNTFSGGTATVSGNAVAFSMTVVSDVTALTEHDGTGYVGGGKALAAPMAITASQGGTPVSAGTTTSTPLIPVIPVGTGLLGTEVYDLEFAQATTLADSALAAGRTYHANLTYTVTTVL